MSTVTEARRTRPSASPHSRAVPRWLARVWASRWRAHVAAAAPATLAAVAGWLTPRGPVTESEAVISLLTAAVVGWAAGLLLRSRWAMLLAPVVFVVVFELVRAPAGGPTVDGLHLNGTYGFLAAVSGRGVHGLLSVAPLVLGAAFGAGAARALAHAPTTQTATRASRAAALARWARRLVAGLAAAALVLVGMLGARPGATAAITGPDGHPLPGSVAELTRIDVGDRHLSVLLRGTDASKPVLLFLAGGPGGSEFGAMRRHLQALEDHFVVATLDQRGTGTSYDALEPLATHTLLGAVDDTVAVTRRLGDRFGQERIYLVGQSWGTILGALTVRAHPELFEAFVGVGQMVSPLATDRMMYADTLDWARRTGKTAVVAELEAIGPPPYTDLLHYPVVLGHEQDVYPYDHGPNAEGPGQMLENLPVPEYGLMDTVNIVRGLLDTFSRLYPQLQDVDLRADAAALAVPVYLVQGRHEARARSELAADWYAGLQAPAKRWVELETSGHRPLFEQPDEFVRVMTQTVLPETLHVSRAS